MPACSAVCSCRSLFRLSFGQRRSLCLEGLCSPASVRAFGQSAGSTCVDFGSAARSMLHTAVLLTVFKCGSATDSLLHRGSSLCTQKCPCLTGQAAFAENTSTPRAPKQPSALALQARVGRAYDPPTPDSAKSPVGWLELRRSSPQRPMHALDAVRRRARLPTRSALSDLGSLMILPIAIVLPSSRSVNRPSCTKCHKPPQAQHASARAHEHRRSA